MLRVFLIIQPPNDIKKAPRNRLWVALYGFPFLFWKEAQEIE